MGKSDNKIQGREIIMKSLLKEGVNTVFGYPGGQVIPIYDSLYQYQDKIKHIITAHEQAACHAADAYARSTGRVGVVIATSGPGATNLVTGIATAYMDSSPLVAITGNVPINLLGKDTFQEIDIVGVTLPIVKHSFLVRDVNTLQETLEEAFYIAKSGRPGPVLVDITKDVTLNYAVYKDEIKRPWEKKQIPFSTDKEFEDACKLISKSKKPFAIIGGGVVRSNGFNEVLEFLHKYNIPFSQTLMATGTAREGDQLFVGPIGMHGTKVANVISDECDLLLSIGTRFSDRVTGDTSKFAKHANLLQIDIDKSEFDKNVITDVKLCGSIDKVMAKLIKKDIKIDTKNWISDVEKYKTKYPLSFSKKAKRAKEVLRALDDIKKPSDWVTTEVGQHQMWAGEFLRRFDFGHFITSGGLGTMGFGLGASIGVKTAHPQDRVINIAGDGSFAMNANELATLTANGYDNIEVVLRNKTLGMVRQWQTLFFDKRYSQTDIKQVIDYEALAKAYGVSYFKIAKTDDPKAVFEDVFKTKNACLVEVEIDIDDMVCPMIPPGGSASDTMMYDENV